MDNATRLDELSTSASIAPQVHYSNQHGVRSTEKLVEYSTGERLFSWYDYLTGGWVTNDGETRWDAIQYWNVR